MKKNRGFDETESSSEGEAIGEGFGLGVNLNQKMFETGAMNFDPSQLFKGMQSGDDGAW
jgi:hypothetical protein